MIVEFRVLAVSKEKKSYDTDLVKGIFSINNQILDTVDSLPINAVISLITQNGWIPTVKEVIDTETHILVPLISQSSE